MIRDEEESENAADTNDDYLPGMEPSNLSAPSLQNHYLIQTMYTMYTFNLRNVIITGELIGCIQRSSKTRISVSLKGI